MHCRHWFPGKRWDAMPKNICIFPLTQSADRRTTQDVKGNALTLKQVIALLKQKQGKRSQKDFAAELGISAQFLCDMYLGRRTPGEKVLSRLGLKQTMAYEKAS